MRAPAVIVHKPEWMKTRLTGTENYLDLKKLVVQQRLNTVCEEARCPNIHECWGQYRTLTFMILGDTCTRACRFCAVKTGKPVGLDRDEPRRVAESVAQLHLRHVVITAVARDDLKDGGAEIFAATVRAIRATSPGTTIEVLPSDMGGVFANVKTVMDARPEIFNHNVETVRRLSNLVRSVAKYDRSLLVLKWAKEIDPAVQTKSSLMLGLGERKDEIQQTMDDLLDNYVDILTMGQYVPPTRVHAKFLPLERCVHPDEFAELKEIAIAKGFRHCESGPKVRSSYHAADHINPAMG